METQRVVKVDRVNGKAIKVVLEFFPFQISFIKVAGKVREGGIIRVDGGRDDLFIPRSWYAKAFRQACAIFD